MLGGPIETSSLQRRLESSAGLATSDEMKVNAMKLGQFCPVIVLGNKGLKQCVARDVIAASIRSGYAQVSRSLFFFLLLLLLLLLPSFSLCEYIYFPFSSPGRSVFLRRLQLLGGCCGAFASVRCLL